MERVRRLTSMLSEQRHEEVVSGMSGAAVYYLPEMRAFLKVAPRDGFSDLARERDVLNWLAGKMPIPMVIAYEETDSSEYLLTSAINGVPASEYLSAQSSTPEAELRFAAESARLLRRMHDLPIGGCPLDGRLDVKFKRARKNIELGLLSETDDEFAFEHGGKRPVEVFHELSARRPVSYDLVFTHGDPCMPNIIVDDKGCINGLIDLDGAGVADRYTDIAIFFQSFRRNCRIDVEFETVFCSSYGLEGLDAEKFEYYSKLDDLF